MELSEFIQQYRSPLIGLIASWGAPWSDAADLAQDSFAEAYLRREACRGDWRVTEIFGRWLRGVARNRWRNWARGRKRRARVLSLEPRLAGQLAEAQPEPPSARVEALRAAITRLSSNHRQVILMRYFEDARIADIATLLGVTEKTVEGRLRQARRTLQRMLEGRLPSSTKIRKVILCL